MSDEKAKWIGDTECNGCGKDVTECARNKFYDVPTKFGPWGLFGDRCVRKFAPYKPPMGMGQVYDVETFELIMDGSTRI